MALLRHLPLILCSLYFLFRLLTAHPFIPRFTHTHLPTISALIFLIPIPLLPLLPHILLTTLAERFFLLLSYVLASCLALRHAFTQPHLSQLHPYRAYAYPCLLLWRVDIAMYLLFLPVIAFFQKASLVTLIFCTASALTTSAIFLFELVRRSQSPLPHQLFVLAFQPVFADTTIEHAPPTIRHASAFSLLSFDWVSSIVVTGRSRSLEFPDILPISDRFNCHTSGKLLFSPFWRAELDRPHPRLLMALFNAFGARFMLGGCLKLLNDVFLFVSPMLLKSIISHLQNRSQDNQTSVLGVFFSCAMFASYFTQLLVFNQYFNVMSTMQALLRGAIVSAVFEKSCRLSPESRALYTSGQIQNLMSNDSRMVADVVLYLHMVWSSAEQITVAMILLVQLLGWGPTVAGILFIIFSMLVQSKLVRMVKNYRETASARTDERVKFVAEAIKGIKLVKLYAWELSFVKRILGARTRELEQLRKMALLDAWNSVLVTSLPTILTIIAFTTFALFNNVLDAAIVFPAIALFNVIRPSLLFLPNILISTARAGASLNRLRSFLVCEELVPLQEGDHSMDRDLLEFNKIDLATSNASFTWDPSISRDCPTLSGVSFWIPEGKLVAVVGPTGSGKSTLLAGLLGEVPIVDGEAAVRQGLSISFCDQVPFIQNATVRDNILFGKPYNEASYRTTIRVCTLLPDLKMLPAGDLTEIGGRGVNLSGGQRARVALARAVYARADICFLDDPLCAVDAHVGKSIFQKCIVSELRGTTRILTTNQIHYAAAPEVDIVIVVKNGTVVEAGPRRELLSLNSEFSRMVKAAGELGSSSEPSSSVVGKSSFDSRHRKKRQIEKEELDIQQTLLAAERTLIQADDKTPITETDGMPNYGAIEAGKLIKKETKHKGRVKFKHYKTYLNGMGSRSWVPAVCFCAIGSQAMSLCVNIWLSDWSDQKTSNNTFYRLSVFFVFGFLTIVITGIASFSLQFGSIRASVRLHEKLLLSVFGAPSSFFNSTPDGRLVNRFNSDLDKIDSSLADTLQSLLRLSLNLVFTLALILWATPLFILVMIPIAAICLYVQEFYRKTSVDLRRLEALARSPLYSHFSETLDGVVTIRAFDDVPRATMINSQYTDSLVQTTYASTYANRWLSVRLEGLGTILIFSATLLAVLTPPDKVSASMVGLVLSYTMQILGVMTWSVRQFTETESQLSAVERVAEYSEPPFAQEEKGGLEQFMKDQSRKSQNIRRSESTGLISKETASSLTESLTPHRSRWPRKGKIEFKDVEMKYREDLNPALRNVSFTVEPGEHIGIVGRTGAGKSSAIQSLFRLYELNDGQIIIDDMNISTMRLFDLRSSLGIIPQEPVCFSGTIRSNLDMFGDHSDREVQKAFDACGLQDTMKSKVNLDFEVAENGSNFSVGQRQLLCLGRALLKDSQVLVLDEATSSVSNATDEKIQKTLRDEMGHCTILTVAHRLHTVMRNDKIIVMDRGRVAEIGHPNELLNRPSRLSELVDETGPATAAHLRYLASLPRYGDENGHQKKKDLESLVEANGNENRLLHISEVSDSNKSLRENVRAAFLELRTALTEYDSKAWKEELVGTNTEESQWKENLMAMISKLAMLANSLSGADDDLNRSSSSFGTGIPLRSVEFLAEAIQDGDSRVVIPMRSGRSSPADSDSSTDFSLITQMPSKSNSQKPE
ncbi:unnamed protein product [Agarophyton chilense]|eukprot:gb/GEZJ01002429.1/.p1 GENE.gb/GEZJ01002429.1/~~gb/GEZJ01002429.1/.p1  ORF type:complete len:1680 (-),score=215.20 gb/GEZJ01002429.1/:6306-11345(-)